MTCLFQISSLLISLVLINVTEAVVIIEAFFFNNSQKVRSV